MNDVDDALISGCGKCECGPPAPIRRRRYAILIATVFLVVIASYLGSFFAVRREIPITTYEGVPLYFFSRNEALNQVLWEFYRPIHRQTGRQPHTFNEWIIEQRNSDAIYVRDISPWERELK
jgi:hypothetical protein